MVTNDDVQVVMLASLLNVFKKSVHDWVIPDGIKGLAVELGEGAGAPCTRMID